MMMMIMIMLLIHLLKVIIQESIEDWVCTAGGHSDQVKHKVHLPLFWCKIQFDHHHIFYEMHRQYMYQFFLYQNQTVIMLSVLSNSSVISVTKQKRLKI